MLHRPLALLSFACCLLVVASFAMFATDRLAGASRHQQDALQPPAPGAASHRTGHGQPRAFIDRAAADLTRPYDGFLASRNAWLARGLPAAIAVLVYGFGLGAIVRFLRR